MKFPILFYLLFVVFGTVFQHCIECDDQHVIIGEQGVNVVDLETNRSDTIKNNFNIFLSLNFDQFSRNNCSYDIVNPIVKESINIYMSEDFELYSETILAGENLTTLDGTFVSPDASGGSLYISFSPEFIDSSTFKVVSHEITVECMTNDSLFLSNSTFSVFDL